VARIGQSIAHVGSGSSAVVFVRAGFYVMQMAFILQIYALTWTSNSA
jgi:hypothetical protein